MATADDSPEEKPSLELDREDVQRLKEIMRPDPDWIAFSSTEARWINFNAQMRAVFGRSRSCRCDEEMVNAWIDDAMSVLFHWISKQTPECRYFDRGSVEKQSVNRQHDIQKLKLKGDMLKKYTTGYMPMSELVFLIYGIAPAMPIIGIQKWSPHYKEVDRWAKDDIVKRAVEKPPARMEQSNMEFESLLASLKKEAGLMPGEHSEPELADLSLLDEHLDVDDGAAVH
eukprot:g27061.t1